MQQIIKKWGNSLALRIPKSIADSGDIRRGSLVNMFIEDGKLIIQPIQGSKFSLEALLSQITDDNKHSETDTGTSIFNIIFISDCRSKEQ